MIVSRSVYTTPYGKVFTRQSHSMPILLSLKVATPENKPIDFDAVIHKQERPPHMRFLRSRMQLTLHATHRTPHGASRLAQAMPAWSMKYQRAPSRHCSDVRVYGHTTSAMHDTSIPPSFWLWLQDYGHARQLVHPLPPFVPSWINPPSCSSFPLSNFFVYPSSG